MAKMKFELNRAGVRELMRSAEMQNVLIREAKRMSDAAGEGYDVYVGQNRANVQVQTMTEEAYNDNLDHNTLEKAKRRR
ncbi:MAG: hypothetical protein K6A77_11485 [Clostridiales bacterium]|nr:hypothetical protein [Clostridiales bacterium]